MEISKVSASDPALRHPHYRPDSKRVELSAHILGRPYQWMLKTDDRAVEVLVGGQIAVRMPARFARYDWQRYQPESVAAVVQWVRQNPRGVVLDIGRPEGTFAVGGAAGIYSLIAFFAGPQIEVVTFDSDLPRLAKVRRLCTYAQSVRLRVVYGFIGDVSTEVIPLSEAIVRTDNHFRAAAAWGGLGMMRYDVRISPFRPVHFRLLDHLFLQDDLVNRPMLIRSHEQGGQVGVLTGAQRLLERARPYLLLTVHPEELRRSGHSREQLQRFLESNGYEFSCLAAGHEERWCQFKTTNSAET
jgi:hypothetical protein